MKLSMSSRLPRAVKALCALCAFFAVATLSGCATAWRVDSEVQSFSSLPAADVASATAPPGAPSASPATFRFDRLPLQQANPAQQAQQTALEAMALPALTQVGMVQDEANARYNVQVSAQLQMLLPADWGYRPGWWGPRTSIWYGRGVAGGGLWWPYGGYGPGYGPGFGMEPGWDERSYQRQVSVVMRDAQTGQVVYETRASHLGRWPVDRDVLPLMFSAAMSGFPQPPAGLRRVNITVPR